MSILSTHNYCASKIPLELSKFFADIDKGNTFAVRPRGGVLNWWNEVSEESTTIYLEVPGLKAENIEIAQVKDNITLKFLVAKEDVESNQKKVPEALVKRYENRNVNFKLGSEFDSSTLQASLSNGLLRLNFSKQESETPKRVGIKSDF